MSATKVAVSMDETLLQRLDEVVRTYSFRSRSQVIQEAVAEKIDRMDKTGLARECAKLDRAFEQALADEGLAAEVAEWTRY
jgi:metal-responsive CopG/Arc/MetJ family transcriptional regulator